MPTQTYPTEIWEAILAQLHTCYPEPKSFGRRRGIEGYLACALVGRVLSDIARPHIFRTILIDSNKRGQSLLDFIRSSPNDNILWIKEVYVGVNDIGPGMFSLKEWLSTQDAVSCFSLLTNVQHLHMQHMTLRLATVSWKSLCTLQKITSLNMRLCSVPSLPLAWKLFTDTFPDLRDLHLDSVTIPNHLDPESLQYLESVKDDNKCTIQRLTIRTGHHDYFGLLLPRIDFSYLTEVEVTPTDMEHKNDHSFSHLQHLLHLAPSLQRLILARCIRVTDGKPGLFDLASNSNLQCITFEGVSGRIASSWYADLLKTLPRITQLRYLKFAGELETLYDKTWLILDSVLSDPDFISQPDRRMVVFEHVLEEVAAGGATNISSAYDFPQDLLSKTIALGAFIIEWPVPFSSMRKGRRMGVKRRRKTTKLVSK